jgi:hypothetical protein
MATVLHAQVDYNWQNSFISHTPCTAFTLLTPSLEYVMMKAEHTQARRGRVPVGHIPMNKKHECDLVILVEWHEDISCAQLRTWLILTAPHAVSRATLRLLLIWYMRFITVTKVFFLRFHMAALAKTPQRRLSCTSNILHCAFRQQNLASTLSPPCA